MASGMVEELSSQRLACRFTHELVRRALYDRLSRARRAELHLRVGEALESSRAGADPRVADLAHHFGAAAPFGGAERAIEYNLRAARQASESLDFEDGAARLRTAIEIGIEEPPKRAEVYLELGEIYRRAGRTTESMDAFSSVARIARELGSSELLAAAAIGYEEASWRPGIATAEAVELLEEALAALAADDEEARVGLLGGLARALTVLGDRERGAIVRGNSIALARRHGDRTVLARVLVRSYWARGSTPLEEILAMVTEARDLAAEGGDAEIQADAMAWRTAIFVSLGDVGSARAEVAGLRERAEATAQPFMHHVAEHYGSALALSDGRLADAEAMAVRSNEWGGLMTGRDTSGTFGVQMFGIRREQGRLAELAPAVRILAGEEGRAGPWLPGLVAVLAELGMEEEAGRELARVVGAGLGQFRETLWLSSLTYLADAAAALGDAEMAALLYPELEPLAGTNVMIGHLVAFHGSADRYLGMLAATTGERDRAARHFEAAMEMNRAMGADTWVAHTAYQHARLLVGGGAKERERGDSLLREASSLAERIGLGGLRAKIAALGLAPATPGFPTGSRPARRRSWPWSRAASATARSAWS